VAVDLDDAAYERLVRQAKEYILAGDIFQVVLSRGFTMPCPASPFAVYRALRMVNPSPFMFYLQHNGYAVAGASPERLVRTQGRRVETMPIAGTRPRGEGAEDARLEAELLADPKERAEHMMLVDLARNDLGQVAEPGTVVVEELGAVQRLSKVMHLTSRVAATLRSDRDGLDALRVALPAGTLSGAPKIRAMEIIDELEHSRRGLYGGAVGYLDGSGHTDSCIAIRMAEIADGVARVRAGAGIVHDSDPAAEAAETRHKARGVIEAVRLAVEGL
jgi:anthranilate synthase component 1